MMGIKEEGQEGRENDLLTKEVVEEGEDIREGKGRGSSSGLAIREEEEEEGGVTRGEGIIEGMCRGATVLVTMEGVGAAGREGREGGREGTATPHGRIKGTRCC